MRTRSLHGDRWQGVVNNDWHLDHPSWQDVLEAMHRLDEKTFTTLTIRGDGDLHLTIGGGAGRYVVYVTFDNHDFWNLLTPTDDDRASLTVNAGGQEGDYQARQIVDAEHARRAAHHFFLEERLDASLRWEKQL